MDIINDVLGLKEEGLEWYQMALRAIISYLAILLMIRIGNKRFLGKLTSHDIILAIILGSIVSRGITGAAPLWTSLITAMVLIILHGTLSYLALKNDKVGSWVKGKRKVLIEDGVMDKETMKSSKISEEDIMMAARSNGVNDMEEIKCAYLEKNGDISVIKK